MTADEMKAFRERNGLTQQELADELGLSVSRIADYERGTTRGSKTGRPAPIPRVVQLAMVTVEARSKLLHEIGAWPRPKWQPPASTSYSTPSEPRK